MSFDYIYFIFPICFSFTYGINNTLNETFLLEKIWLLRFHVAGHGNTALNCLYLNDNFVACAHLGCDSLNTGKP